MAPGCERSRPVVAGPGGAYAVALRSMHGGLCPVSYAPSPAPRARVSRVLLPAASSPCSASCVLRPASCTPCPRARAPCPCPCPRPRFTCSAFRVPRFASRAPRPRLPCSASRTRTRTRTRGPAPRARAPVFCVPQTVARVPRPISPPTLRGGSFRLRHAAGMKRKSGGSPQEPPDFACIAAARLTRACG